MGECRRRRDPNERGTRGTSGERFGEDEGDKAVLEAVGTTSDGSLIVIRFVKGDDRVGTAGSSSESDSSSHFPVDCFCFDPWPLKWNSRRDHGAVGLDMPATMTRKMLKVIG